MHFRTHVKAANFVVFPARTNILTVWSSTMPWSAEHGACLIRWRMGAGATLDVLGGAVDWRGESAARSIAGSVTSRPWSKETVQTLSAPRCPDSGNQPRIVSLAMTAGSTTCDVANFADRIGGSVASRPTAYPQGGHRLVPRLSNML